MRTRWRRRAEKRLLEKEVAMNAMKWFAEDWEVNEDRLETKKSLLMKKNKEVVSCYTQMTTSGGRIIDKLLNHTPLVYLGFTFNIEKRILRYCSREVP